MPVMKKTVSMSGARRRLSWAIWSSDSKSLTARRPRTMAVGAELSGEVHGQPVEADDLDALAAIPGSVRERLPDDRDARVSRSRVGCLRG